MDYVKLWLEFKEVFIDLVKYGFPTIALFLSLLSYWDSRKTKKVQVRLNELEEKLKRFELEDKEKEREESTKAMIEARIMNISRGKYRMKLWNSGKVTAYNVDFETQEDSKAIVLKEKVPYEFLEPGKSFEEHVIVHSGTFRKFKVTTIWTDKQGNNYSKDQIVTI
ncbi:MULTISPECIES: hypothetical protein [Bacillaceae]|jgi:hypothetical protein|uniref:Uncharacterized protein n=1 Tax=Rossellomorea vietnamensis TaxID=218284 RepID=A0A6I6UTH0_9BACI|nr:MULTISPECIES: hypothetical protein [Rossellomorea]MBW3111218.1 hypothetical protein [Bacillus sp. MCCB 382]MDX8345226.1 hypothetical protein [Rossellomorea sp. YZS02]QHE62851.1 hypothetical protein FHE72_18965 [Rossellomorea vietnamensis]